MPNKLQPLSNSAINISSDGPTSSIYQTGEKNVYANHVDKMNITIQAGNITPQLLTPKSNQPIIPLCRTHYNFFVSYEIALSESAPFTIEASRALTEYMDADLKTEFSTLTPEALNKIKTFPCLFANENTAYGHTDEEQNLGYGYIRQLKVRRDGIKIYPQIEYLLPQQRLNEALFELDIRGSSSFNEFNRMHWSIKKIDLIAELQELGFQL